MGVNTHCIRGWRRRHKEALLAWAGKWSVCQRPTKTDRLCSNESILLSTPRCRKRRRGTLLHAHPGGLLALRTARPQTSQKWLSCASCGLRRAFPATLSSWTLGPAPPRCLLSAQVLRLNALDGTDDRVLQEDISDGGTRKKVRHTTSDYARKFFRSQCPSVFMWINISLPCTLPPNYSLDCTGCPHYHAPIFQERAMELLQENLLHNVSSTVE